MSIEHSVEITGTTGITGITKTKKTTEKQVGLLVLSYGTPANEEQIGTYLAHIRAGQIPSAEEIEELAARYRAIGGLSPLREITCSQAKVLRERLAREMPGHSWRLYTGAKHSTPFIEEAVRQMSDDGIKEAVVITMAPYFSPFSAGEYLMRARSEARRQGIYLYEVKNWQDQPGFSRFWAEELRNQLDRIQPAQPVRVIFTAHSLPEQVLATEDPYPQLVQKTAAQIAAEAELESSSWTLAWQSAGSRGNWLTPSVDVAARAWLEKLAKELFPKGRPRPAIIYAPIGFVCDHLEILYDNDVVCRALCEELGATYYRTRMPNTNPAFIGAMAGAVQAVISSAGGWPDRAGYSGRKGFD